MMADKVAMTTATTGMATCFARSGQAGEVTQSLIALPGGGGSTVRTALMKCGGAIRENA
jgi:hypothetical protein